MKYLLLTIGFEDWIFLFKWNMYIYIYILVKGTTSNWVKEFYKYSKKEFYQYIQRKNPQTNKLL